MRVVRTCQTCGDPFEASRRDARFCSAKCRKKSWSGVPHVVQPATLPGPIWREARAVLDRLGVDPAGDDVARAALRCAEAMDDPLTPPSALAGISRALMDGLEHVREFAKKE